MPTRAERERDVLLSSPVAAVSISRTLVLVVGCALGCAASAGQADAPPARAGAVDEPGILATFAGTDAQAMAALGRRLEGERPPLSRALLDSMLALLVRELDGDGELRMMRATLFRTTASILGVAARPTLARCIETSALFRQLCYDTELEIGARQLGPEP